MKTASWVIVNKETGKAELETFSAELARLIENHSRTHHVIPILEWLQSLNRA